MSKLTGILNTLTGGQAKQTQRDAVRRVLNGMFGHDILIMDPQGKPGYLRSTQLDQHIFYKNRSEGRALHDAGVKSGSYYAVYEGYTDPGDPTRVPLKIDIGFMGKGGFPVEMLSIYLDHEKDTGVEVNFCGPWALGLDSAEGRTQTMMMMKTVGRLMKRIEAGEDINPYELRQHLIDKTGIKPLMWTVQPVIERNYPGGICAHPELGNAERMKRLRIIRRSDNSRNNTPK